MTKRRCYALTAAVMFLIAATLSTFAYIETVSVTAAFKPKLTIYYFNDEVSGDVVGSAAGDGNIYNDYNFGDNRHEALLAEKEFLSSNKLGELSAKEVLALTHAEFLALAEQNEDAFNAWNVEASKIYGDLVGNYDNFRRAQASSAFATAEEWSNNDHLDRITPIFSSEENPNPRGSDPALAAATLVDAYHNFAQTQFLPKDIAALPKAEQPDALHLRFLEDPTLWVDLIEKYTKYIEEEATFSYEEISSYTSSAYMKPDGLKPPEGYEGVGMVPSTVVHNTNNGSGHVLVITTKHGIQKLRAECGWQSIRTWYVNPPTVEIEVPETTPPPSIEIEINDYTSLVLSKTVTSGSSRSQSFRFDYSFSQAVTLNGTKVTSGSVWLSHGESVTFTGIKSGTTYTITEAVPSGWESNRANNRASGTVYSNRVQVGFTNTQKDEEEGKDPSKDPVNQGNAPVGGGQNDDPGPGTFQPVEPDKPSKIVYSHYTANTSAITVNYGTAAGSLSLPTTVTYHSTTGETGRGSLSVSNWGGYDGGTAGTYVITLQATNSSSVAWAPAHIDGITVKVTVRENPNQPPPPTTNPGTDQPNQDGATPPPTDPIPVVTDSHDVDDDNSDGAAGGSGDSSAGNENGSLELPPG